MPDINLLAIIKRGDETHYLLRKFFKSLPNNARKVFDSLGAVGSLDKNVREFGRMDMRHFVIFCAPTFNWLVNGYFASISEAALFEIPDELRVKVIYKQQDTDFSEGVEIITESTGTIDEMVRKYEELSSADPRRLLTDELNHYPAVRKRLVKREWFGLGRKRVVPTYVSVGIETPDRKYLLGTTGAQGPYTGKPPYISKPRGVQKK